MTLFIIRHGQDLPNYRGGWSNNGLTDAGKEQSFRLGNFLTEMNISRIISSDLLRAKETADIVNKCLNLPIEYTSEWREINSGTISGMTKAESDKKYPNFYIEKMGIDQHFPNGESPREFYDRIITALISLQQKALHDERIVLITHGGVIMALLHYFEGLDWVDDRKYIKVEKCSINTAAFENSSWRLINKGYDSY